MKKMLFFCGMLLLFPLLPKTAFAAAASDPSSDRQTSGDILGGRSDVLGDPEKDKSITAEPAKQTDNILGMSSADQTISQEGNSAASSDEQKATEAASAAANNPTLVGNAAELEQAIRAGETYVKLTADINIDQLGIPVKNSLTIDGDNKYTYMYNGGENWHHGIYFAANNIEITFKNLKIGDPKVSKSANNYYGIAPADDSINNSKIIVENVDYYSDRGAQPFHMRMKTNQIVFKGKNSFFTTKKEAGIACVQEFAEGTNFLFEENSDTSIKMENNELVGTFWSVFAPIKIELKKNARLKVDSCNAFIYSDVALGNKLIIGEGAVLDVNETDKVKGKLIFQDHELDIDVQENGQLIANTAAPTPFNLNSSLNLGPGSKAKLKNKNGDFYCLGIGTIKIDNADELSFETGKRGGTSPTGLTGLKDNLLFVAFNNDTRDYGIYADDQRLETQHQPSSWKISGKEFDRGTVFLYPDTPDKIKEASSFKLLRNRISSGNDGKLELASVPDFDFGDHLVADTTQILRPAVKGTLIVEDTRTKAGRKSKLSLKVIQPLKNGDLELADLLTYTNSAGQEQLLSDQTVLIEETVDQDMREISSEWNMATDGSARGLKLSVPVEKQKAGTYTGAMEWSLEDVPSN